MDKKCRRRRTGTQVGAAAVEFALLLPVMMGVIAGITDFGRFFFTQIELTNAAREGARAGIVADPGQRIAQATARANAALEPPPAGLLPPDVQDDCDGATGELKVVLIADFDWMFLRPIMGVLPGPDTLLPPAKSTAVMRCN